MAWSLNILLYTYKLVLSQGEVLDFPVRPIIQHSIRINLGSSALVLIKSGRNLMVTTENHLRFAEHIPSFLQHVDLPSTTQKSDSTSLYSLFSSLCRHFHPSNFWLTKKDTCPTTVLHWPQVAACRFKALICLQVCFSSKWKDQCLDGGTYMLHHSVLQVLPPFLPFLWIREHICRWAVGWALSQLLPIILHQTGPAHQLHSGELLQQVPGNRGSIY